MKRTLILIFILLTTFVQISKQGVIIGASCYGICLTSCLSMAPGKFAAIVGIVFDIQGCSAMCMPVCARGLAIPGYCFDIETTILRVREDNMVQTIKITDARVGDIVLTTDWMTKQVKNTRITGIEHVQEQSLFIEIAFQFDESLASRDKIVVTAEHIMLIQDGEGKVQGKEAAEVKVGDQLLTTRGIIKITEVLSYTKPQRIEIETAEGTIIANGVLTTSHCRGKYEMMEDEF